MENKELLEEYNSYVIGFIKCIDRVFQENILGGRVKPFSMHGTIKGVKEYEVETTFSFDEKGVIIGVSSECPYTKELRDLLQWYIDYVYNECLTVKKVSEPDKRIESFFEELVRQSDEDGKKGFAIGCPDEQMPFLREVADYINKQDGWSAYIDDKDILVVERL